MNCSTTAGWLTNMRMPKRYTEALNQLDLHVVYYVIDYDGNIRGYADESHAKLTSPAKIWGRAIVDKDGVEWAVIEHEADEYGGNWRFYLRSHRGDRRNAGIFKTLREALIRFIEMGQVPIA
jgi:hypothetical protein